MKFDVSKLNQVCSVEQLVLLKLSNEELYSQYAENDYFAFRTDLNSYKYEFLGFINQNKFDPKLLNSNLDFNGEYFSPVYYLFYPRMLCVNDYETTDKSHLLYIKINNPVFMRFSTIDDMNAEIQRLKESSKIDLSSYFFLNSGVDN